MILKIIFKINFANLYDRSGWGHWDWGKSGVRVLSRAHCPS